MTNSTSDPWWVLGVAAVAVVLLLGAARLVFPRREWHPVGDGHALIVHDRWTGRFQRAEWDQAGHLLLMDVYTSP